MKREGLLAIIGGLLLVAGLLIGFVPVHALDGKDCGSAFHSNVRVLHRAGEMSAAAGNGLDLTADAAECDAKHNSTRPIAILLVVLGIVGLAAAFIDSYTNYRREEAAAAD